MTVLSPTKSENPKVLLQIIKTTEERLAVIETKLGYIEEGMSRIELNLQTITDNHIAHINSRITEIQTENSEERDLLKIEIQGMKQFCREVQTSKKYGLRGKEKVIVYGSLITAVAAVVIEIIRNL